jgi:hypothetical protein
MTASRYNAAVQRVPMPDRISALPVSEAGFPVPWFVHWADGVPDFRVVGAGKLVEANNKRKCWVCGQPLGKFMATILGPMCVVNRTISEPPSHRECAIFSALACPFLSNPRMRRREAGLPDEIVPAAGNGIKRNPGACAVWVTREFGPFKVPGGGVLFRVGDPHSVVWYAEGRAATREEVEASIASGLPILMEDAQAEGPAAVAALHLAVEKAMQYLPDAIPPT